jgi:hypothetical protein
MFVAMKGRGSRVTTTTDAAKRPDLIADEWPDHYAESRVQMVARQTSFGAEISTRRLDENGVPLRQLSNWTMTPDQMDKVAVWWMPSRPPTLTDEERTMVRTLVDAYAKARRRDDFWDLYNNRMTRTEAAEREQQLVAELAEYRHAFGLESEE